MLTLRLRASSRSCIPPAAGSAEASGAPRAVGWPCAGLPPSGRPSGRPSGHSTDMGRQLFPHANTFLHLRLEQLSFHIGKAAVLSNLTLEVCL